MDITRGQPQIFRFHIITQSIYVSFRLKFSGTSLLIYHLHLTVSTLEVGFVSEASSSSNSTPNTYCCPFIITVGTWGIMLGLFRHWSYLILRLVKKRQYWVGNKVVKLLGLAPSLTDYNLHSIGVPILPEFKISLVA